MKISSEEIYNNVRLSKVSGSCEAAAIDYFDMVSSLCLNKPDIAHSLLRIAIRPVFYLGITNSKDVVEYIRQINKERVAFLQWLEENKSEVTLIVKELIICCYFYSLRYDMDKNTVILDHKVSNEMSSVFIEIQDKDIYKEFSSFEDFKMYFYSLFNKYGLSKAELDRLILEEDYKEQYFSRMM